MKKSQLRKLIRESIKELMNEQPMLNEGTMTATVCTCGGYKTSTTFFNPAGSTGPCMTPNNPFPSSTNTPDQQGNPQYAVGTWSAGIGAGCNSGYAYTTHFQNDPPTAHSNPEYTWFDQVHNDANGNCIPNPIDCTPSSSGCPCSLQDFRNAAGPYLTNHPNLMSNWIPMFHGKYMSAADCCKFLQKRLQVQMNKNQTTMGPIQQAQVQAKINAIKAIIKKCCPPPGIDG